MRTKFKISNKVLSVLLCMSLLLSYLPLSSLTAFAAETSVATGYCNNTGTEASRIAIWELSTDGTLTIKKSPSGGTGMSDFSSSTKNRPSWETYKDQIKKVVIEDDITSLGSYAFYQYTALEEVVIGDGISAIPLLGFCGCTKLSNVTIGSSVKEIKGSAFNGCTSLTNVTLPNGVTTIRSQAFASCPMTEITIPASVTTIENMAFNGTKLTKVTYLGTTDPGATSINVFPYINKAYPTIHVPADYIGTTFCKCTVTKAEATTDINAIVVSATPADGGSVDITVNGESADKAEKGTVVTITVTENDGYVLKSLIVADADDGNIELTKNNNKYTFTMPEKAVSVTAVFKEDSSLVYVGKTVLGIGTYYKCANNTLTSDGTAGDYNAYLTFNEATGYTLNIKNLTVSGVQNTNYGAGIYSANDDIALTINFAGTNIINGAENETNAAIYSLGDLNITGSGTLTANGSATISSNHIQKSCGVAVDDGKSISITNANVVYANAGYVNYSPGLSQGLRASNILIENSIVYAKGGQSVGQSGYSEGIEVVSGTLRIKGAGTKVEAISGDEGYSKNGISGHGGSNTLYLESGLLRVESKNATEYSSGITGIKLNMTGGIFEAVCGTAINATPIANPPTIAEGLLVYDSDNNIINYTNDYTIFKNYSFVRIAPPHIHEWVYSASGNVITAYCNASKNPCEYSGTEKAVSLTLAANGGTYTGNAYKANIVNNISDVTGASAGAISYYKVDAEGATTGGTAVSEAKNVGYYYAAVTLGEKTAVKAFTISKASGAKVSVTQSGLVYNGEEQEPGITVKDSAGKTIPAEDYTVDYANNKNATTETSKASVTVTFKDSSNYTGTATATFDIAQKPVTVSGITAKNKTYDGTTDATLDCSNAVITDKIDGDSVNVTATGTFSDKNAKNGKTVTISNITLDNSNYTLAESGQQTETTANITPKKITATITPGGGTYGGTITPATAKLNGVLEGDEVSIMLLYSGTANDGTSHMSKNPPTKAGNYIVTVTMMNPQNYIWEKLAQATFTVNKADQDVPDVTGRDETISGKKDGVITAVNSTMEYRKDGESTYTAISGDKLENLAAGKYYVRIKGDSNHNPSPDTEVTIAAGRKLTVTIPTAEEQIGYTLTVDKNALDWQGQVMITFALADGYSKSETDFAVKVNGSVITLDENEQYIVTGAETDLTITVAGVVDETAPEAEISITTNKWTDFLKDITFGLFFKETQDVTITAIDKGSGEDKIYYYISEDVLTEDEVKMLAADKWTLYDADNKPSIDPDKKCVVYAKTADNAQNVKFISSDGLVFDGTAPELVGIENNGVYYGDKIFKALDDNFLKIEVDGIDITDTTEGDDEFEIVADNAEHTVTVTDKAGNVTEYKITVYKNYTVTFKAAGVTVDTQTVGHGKDATAPAIPEKEGYTQTAPTWDKDGKNITTDTEINAVYTINKYTVTYKADGEVVDTVTVEHGKDATAPAVPAKDGYVDKWDKDGKNITEDTVISAVYTKIPVVKLDEVKPEDKTDLMSAKADLEKALEENGENYTEDEKKAIENEIKRLDESLAIIGRVEAAIEKINNLPENITENDEEAIKAAEEALGALSDYEKSLISKEVKKALDDAKAALAELKKPAESTSPKTYDNTSLWMCFALLFISGGTAFGAVICKKKREADEN